MTKTEFIDNIKPLLKKLEYRKVGLYWHQKRGGLIYSIQVQGSSWDKDTYYLNFGITFDNEQANFPTELHWNLEMRCFVGEQQTNISPEDCLKAANGFFGKIQSRDELTDILHSDKALRIGKAGERYTVLHNTNWS